MCPLCARKCGGGMPVLHSFLLRLIVLDGYVISLALPPGNARGDKADKRQEGWPAHVGSWRDILKSPLQGLCKENAPFIKKQCIFRPTVGCTCSRHGLPRPCVAFALLLLLLFHRMHLLTTWLPLPFALPTAVAQTQPLKTPFLRTLSESVSCPPCA